MNSQPRASADDGRRDQPRHFAAAVARRNTLGDGAPDQGSGVTIPPASSSASKAATPSPKWAHARSANEAARFGAASSALIGTAISTSRAMASLRKAPGTVKSE